MNKDTINFIQKNSPDGGFLQSEEWRKFQEAAGRKTYNIFSDDFWANIIEHKLPVVGKYFYIPRGPVLSTNVERISNFQFPISNKISIFNDQISEKIQELIKLAQKEKIGWIRIEPATEELLEEIKNNIESIHLRRTGLKIQKAPHDMQPKEILMIDIMKSEEQLLAEMKPKTRYNIKLAEKHNVKVSSKQGAVDNKYIDEFIRLTKIMGKRQKIAIHPENYYRKMTEVIPNDILKLYVAEYNNKIIAANLVVFYGNTCTYLHGASDDSYRNVMAPHLLQLKQIQDAKKAGCRKYDLGGVATENLKSQISNLNKIPNPKSQDTKYQIQNTRYNSWAGITRFKTRFTPSTLPIKFPGSYDIVINPMKYRLYKIIQKVKSIIS